MAYALAKFKVADYERWKQGFAAGEETRKAAGPRGAVKFRSASDPNEIILLVDWDNLEVGRQVGDSPKVLELQQASGVISPFEPYRRPTSSRASRHRAVTSPVVFLKAEPGDGVCQAQWMTRQTTMPVPICNTRLDNTIVTYYAGKCNTAISLGQE